MSLIKKIELWSFLGVHSVFKIQHFLFKKTEWIMFSVYSWLVLKKFCQKRISGTLYTVGSKKLGTPHKNSYLWVQVPKFLHIHVIQVQNRQNQHFFRKKKIFHFFRNFALVPQAEKNRNFSKIFIFLKNMFFRVFGVGEHDSGA